ncbi:hypothetical protein ACLQ81_17000 [Bordetella avium]|uniref:hypothetical protein n=3 Tax=Bordetella avium TaxID=521 RepID=UPI000E167C0F|nr:hypothetical protein [Bordetella avium]UOK17058.1 replication protein [Bordetella phage vB_BaM-IFTN1]UOK17185.1 HNH endonuclease [Bordetella phage vB_BaM-IFTN3]UOK17457.1 HNH endonuclease [Bordetella phage vB_BaM-IFTN7]RIQ11411.1 hypothetical protein D0432_16815 [Bordetella avium]RIQ17474.1 hypothetical protein D0850_11465 [Bordetella avium]
MARARNIKPSFFANDDLADINPLGRLLFIGLWTMADREGRLEDRPRRIKAEVLPYDDCDVDSLLQDLSKHGFILRYEVGGDRFIQVPNFTKHQNPHIKESASQIPAPVQHCASTMQEQCEKHPEPEPAGLIPDSGFLNPESKEIPPNPPSPGGDEPGLPSAGKPKRERKVRCTLKTFIDQCREAGETAISGYQPLLEYVDGTGLPMDFVQLAWEVFKGEHLAGGANERRLQADWRRHFLNYVTKGYYRLWYANAEGHFSLTTVGIQAKKIHLKEAA